MKRAFTLIELLAVIVILAVVTVIAVPIINNAVEDSRESANLRSVEGYARAVEQKYYEEGMPVIDSDFLASVNTGGGEVICTSVSFSAEYSVILNSCTVENNKDKTYCYAGGKHYDCGDTEFLNILSQLGN